MLLPHKLRSGGLGLWCLLYMRALALAVRVGLCLAPDQHLCSLLVHSDSVGEGVPVALQVQLQAALCQL